MKGTLLLLAILPGCAAGRPCGAPCDPCAPCEAPCARVGPGRPEPAPAFDAVPLVDPFIGTGGHGHTFPGASVPFGMVQLSPDTRLDGWDGCSGYHRSDDQVYGFSHTHLSGTGCSDYGDVLLVPTVGSVLLANGADGKPGYRSKFQHDREHAEPGYYSVFLDDPKILVELTATARAGVHRYTFPRTAEANVVLDLTHRDEVLDASVEGVGPNELRGLRRSRAWASDQPVWFVIRFSKPIVSYGISVDEKVVAGTQGQGKRVKAHVRFDALDGRPLEARVGISGVDMEGAARNLDAEVGSAGFDEIRARAREAWRRQLGKVEVEGGTNAQRRTFYTALYHACLAPNLFTDVDGRYLGMDRKVHAADGHEHYGVFSLWDTFRAEHPLLTLIEPRRTTDFVRTMIADWRQGGTLPVWELWGNETGCMIGYHAVPVIADAYAKGVRGFDPGTALEAMRHSAGKDELGLAAYRAHGFIPAEEEGESVSRTLEYAYDDACIAGLARALSQPEVAHAFDARSQSWRNLYDPTTGFFRAKRNGAFVEPFEPAEVNGHYTEANAWQYALFVPQDTDALLAAHGGRAGLEAFLDRLFAASSATSGRDQADISGMIGQYAHGNEPSHGIAYLYCHAGRPSKAQARVREILDTLYADAPDGLCGNEDCGQMSAWYVMSALGFYPVTPGTPQYVIGTPLFPKATLHVGDGRSFTVRAPGSAPDHPYVQRATLGGRPLLGPVLPHQAILDGDELVLEMGPAPSDWGTGEGQAPRASVPGDPIVTVPVLTKGERLFKGSTEVAWASLDGPSEIRVSKDGGKTFAPVVGPLRLEATSDLVAYAVRAGRESARVQARFQRLPHDWTLTLGTRYDAQRYPAGGDIALIDGLHGRAQWWTGDWQGYGGVDVEATVDLLRPTSVHLVRVGFLQDVKSWIWLPKEVVVTVSDDGKEFRPFGSATHEVDDHGTDVVVHPFEVKGEATARWVRVKGTTRGTCPDWHPGAGHPAWLFADEIEIDPAR